METKHIEELRISVSKIRPENFTSLSAFDYCRKLEENNADLLEALQTLEAAHRRMCQSIVKHCPQCSTEMEAHIVAIEAIKKATK